ncbi:MAG TPA: prepilin-type N-terminal cleavage/methylation domain-containing protein [Terriglobales bacterium]|nr:prepilin-type N-terminal cleavage/methylation domain-containing protein [Terriglobales bacterium]
MRQASTLSRRGFTFIELMVSLALGMLVVGAAVKLFSQGVDATWVVSQRAEMQQDLRAVENMLVKDISLAGAGLPVGQGVTLASGTGTSPIYGCDQALNCPPNGAVNYPCAGGCGAAGPPTLYGVMPGYQLGIIPTGSTVTTDLISVSYSDVVLALNCYNVDLNSGTLATFTVQNPLGSSCVLPPGLNAPQAVNDPVVGLTPGDLILFQGTNGVAPNTNTFYAVGEVTQVAGGNGTYTVTFGANDPLQMNQPGAANDLSAYAPLPLPNTLVANRIYVITYYMQELPDPLGATGIPELMRQVSGHTAVPVAENIVNMQYTYDTYNSTGTLLNDQGDGGESAGISLNLIRQINMKHLSIRSQQSGARSALYATAGYQGYDLATSISARNLSYQNRY